MNNTIFNKLEVKDFQESKGVITFYYSIFNNIDLGGDVVMPTAFTKTVAENFKHIYHNRNHCEAVGKPLEFGQDLKGAYCTSQLGIKTIDGADCFEQYKAGIIKGHSMEYNAIKWSYDEVKEVRTITEAKLWGVTSVTNIPMNLKAETISVKSFTDVLEQINEIELFLKTANISDKLGNKMLLKIDSLNKTALSLKESLAVKNTKALNEPINLNNTINYLQQQFKTI